LPIGSKGVGRGGEIDIFSPHPKLIGGVSLNSYQNFHPVDIPEIKDMIAVFYTKIMSSILEHINNNSQETQGLIGWEYDELKGSIQNAEKLHYPILPSNNAK